MISKFILSLLLLCLSSAYAGVDADELNCADSLNEMFSTYSGDRSKIDEFLKIQAGLTMHKLAYASLRNSNTKEEYRLEKEILSMLRDVKDQYNNDHEFKEVYDLFNHPDNRLSRSALSRVLPYIKDIINEQNSEQSAFKRKYFNIGLSDIRLLSVLAEKETKRSNGVYDHRLFRDHEHDNSIMNFTKIINSSVRNTDSDKSSMLKRFEKRLEKLQKDAIALLEEIQLPESCLEEFSLCKDSDDGKVVLDEEFLSLVTDAVLKNNQDANLSLRYDDVWLHTKSRIHGTSAGNERNYYQEDNKEKPPVFIPQEEKLIVYEKSDEEVTLNYLMKHVLDHVPSLFDKEELAANPEFTVALAQAIDRGILTKKGEERSFIYNGHKYILPELWNDEFSDLYLGRVGTKTNSFFSWAFRINEFDEDEVNIPPSIPKSQHDDFIETMNEQYKSFDHKYAFEYNGKLYTYPRGDELKSGLDHFLQKFKKDQTTEVVVNNPLESSELKNIADEIRAGNRSYIKDDQVFHVSGHEAILSKEHGRAKLVYDTNNTKVNEELGDVEFPELSEIQKTATDYPVLVLKAMTDRKRAINTGTKKIDLYQNRVIDRSYAQSIIVENRNLTENKIEANDLITIESEQLENNALALLNNDTIFDYKDDEFYTASGKKVDRSPSGDSLNNSSSYLGLVDHDILNSRIIRLNNLDSEALVNEYYAQNPHPSCEFVTIVNKVESQIKVFKYNGAAKVQVFSSPIALGKVSGDQRTLYRDSSFTNTNNKTGAGEYTFGSSASSVISLEHPFQSGPDKIVPMGLTASETSETQLLINPRQTNGNIEIPEPAKTYYQSNYVETGCPFIVLPESDQLRFKVIEGELQLIPSKSFNHEQKTRDFHLSLSEEVVPKKIEISLSDARFDNENTREFLGALEDEKFQIMKDLDLTNDEYNELVKLSFGIMGTESSFGEGDSHFFGLWNSYKFKESSIGQLSVSMLKGELGVMPVYPGTFIPIQTNPDNNSRGNTQIKNVREFLNKSYPEINRNNLSEPKNSAIATMYALKAKMDMLKGIEENHSAINDENRLDYLYYMYLGSTNQIVNSTATPNLNPKVREANGYADAVKIYTTP